MINLTIDGIPVRVPKGTTVYEAVKQLGIELPIFCYQDRMPPFGACRVCMVEVEKMSKPQTSCTLEATEGMVVKTQSELAVKSREGILELLLINHPLDCPICDRGGECPLQDFALKFGTGESRFVEEKRHFTKPKPLGSVLMLDRERCVVCARCTRFGELIAGDHALEMIDRGFKTEVGTPDGAPVDSKFIGNTIMICPVGALTSQVYRFRARPWDNEPTESTCTLCPVGCSLILDSRDGEIMRTRSCENKNVNDIWLCDKGWFGYEFVSHPDRLQTPLIRKGKDLVPATWDEALTLIAQKFIKGSKIAGLGGDTLTTEENYLFQKLIREGGGVNHVDHRVGTAILSLDKEGIQPGMGESEELSSVMLLGVDLTEEFPVLWLRLKQAINRGAKVIFLGNYAPEIAPHLAQTVLHPPGKEVEFIKKYLPKEQITVFVGSQYLNNPHRLEILSELMKPNVKLNLLEAHGNSIGARFAGMHPELGPMGECIKNPGLNTIQILETAATKGWDFLYVAGANPAKLYPSKVWNQVRKNLGFMVVQDLFLNETAQQADVVLPTLCFVEKRGSFINIEGRIQKLNPGKAIPEKIFSDREIFAMIGQKLNIPIIIDEFFERKLTISRIPFPKPNQITTNSVPEKSSLKASFAPALFNHGVRMKHNEHVIHLVKEPKIRIHPNEGSKLGINQDDLVRIKSGENSIIGKVKLDNTVAEETVVIPIGFDQIPTQELGLNLYNGLTIDLIKEKELCYSSQ